MRAATVNRPRFLFAAAAIVTIASLTPAYSQVGATFGRITEATTPSKGLAANYKRASRFTLPGAGTITRLCAYLDGKGGGGDYQRANLALYADDGGLPGKKVFETSELTVLSGSAAGWTCMAGYTSPLHPVPAGSYWIALHTSAPAGVIRDYADGAANWYGNADAFDDGASSAFGSGVSGNGTMSLYAEYFPDAQLRHAGRTTVGTYPSRGMTANFKRGSSFMLRERGKLYATSAFLDGGGTAPPFEQQDMHYAIYTDVNGFPGAMVYQSGMVGFRSTWPAMWMTDKPSPRYAPTLDPGRYWIAILTGGTGGVSRNFSDGTPGNWYGNADEFGDGASAQFGPGNPGNGTISAFISYRPGTITSGHVGRTDVGTKPSKGLRSNYIRWSNFVTEDVDATLTGLHAYIDGLGATAGSQQVRMVIYGEHVNPELNLVFRSKIAQSEEVTIAAGMTPQWVHFDVPSVPLTSSHGVYAVGIHTGDTAGVVRDYADGRPGPYENWIGAPDIFADGAIDVDERPGTGGKGTLSVYATYSLPPP